MSINLLVRRTGVHATYWVHEVRKRIVARLYATANGDYTPPDPQLDGVCWIIEHAADNHELKPVAQEILASLKRYWGACPDPLGDYMHDGNLWHGLRGDRRRTYAGLLAATLEDASLYVVLNPEALDDGWRADNGIVDPDMDDYLRGFDRYTGVRHEPSVVFE